MKLNEIKNLFVFQSFIAIEQILRWKYLIKFSFPLKYRMLNYYEKRIIFLEKLSGLKKRCIFIHIWFAEIDDDSYDYVFYLYVANDCTLPVNFFKALWYEGFLYFEYINEWNFFLYYYSERHRCFVRIYKKIYDISDNIYKYIKYFLKNVRSHLIGYSFDFDIALKNIVIFIRYFIQNLLYTSNFLLFFKLNIRHYFYTYYFVRWKDAFIVLANGLHHLTDPLIMFDWSLCWKRFFNFDFSKVKILISNLLKKCKFYIISYFMALINFDKVEDLLQLVLLFVFLLSLKNVKFTLLEIYLRISNILFNNLGIGKNCFLYFSKKKDRLKLGKFFFNIIKLVVGNSFYFFFINKDKKSAYVKININTNAIK